MLGHLQAQGLDFQFRMSYTYIYEYYMYASTYNTWIGAANEEPPVYKCKFIYMLMHSTSINISEMYPIVCKACPFLVHNNCISHTLSTTMTSPITSLTIVYSTVYSSADQRKQQSSANSPVTGEFHAQMASNAENVSIYWRHYIICHYDFLCPASAVLAAVTAPYKKASEPSDLNVDWSFSVVYRFLPTELS